jgi:Ca2+/Na+ antiporter
MNSDISTDFEYISKKVFQYHSYVVALFSGVVIGFLTNYLVTYVFPLPYLYGLSLTFLLLAFSVYLFLLYSPEASRGHAEEIVPKTLHEFLHNNFGKLLLYIKLDWEGYAFHRKAISSTGWMASISGVQVEITKVSSHQGEIKLYFPFLKLLRCKFLIRLFVTTLTEVPEYRKIIVEIEMNTFAKFHPKSDLILRTLGIRLRHAIFNPQIVDPKISDEEYHEILKEIRPNVWKAYCEHSED